VVDVRALMQTEVIVAIITALSTLGAAALGVWANRSRTRRRRSTGDRRRLSIPVLVATVTAMTLILLVGIWAFTREPSTAQPAPSPTQSSPAPSVSPSPSTPSPPVTHDLVDPPAPTPTKSSVVRPRTTTAPPPAVFRVESVELRVDPFYGTIDCSKPVELLFSGRINAVGGAGRVTWRWTRDDPGQSPIEKEIFSEPASHSVHTTWYFGAQAPGTRLTGWMQIEIIDPPLAPGTHNDKAAFDVTCA
jgi:hypothetical protein